MMLSGTEKFLKMPMADKNVRETTQAILEDTIAKIKLLEMQIGRLQQQGEKDAQNGFLQIIFFYSYRK